MKIAVRVCAVLLALLTGCGRVEGEKAPANEQPGPIVTLRANVIARLTCQTAPKVMDLAARKRELSEFVELEPIKQLGKGNCQVEYRPIDRSVRVVSVIMPGNSSELTDWAVDTSNSPDAGIGIGKDDVVYLLIHGEKLGNGAVSSGEDIAFGPDLALEQQVKNVQASVLYGHAQSKWR